MRNYRVLIILLLFLSPGCVPRQHVIISPASVVFDPMKMELKVPVLPKGVSIHQLNNGLQVLLIENPSIPMVGINVIVKTGSAYESFHTSGMSHMLEHLLFNGTTTRDQKTLYDDTDRIGGYNNANTSEYYTNYMMVTPKDNILAGMEIQSDMLFNSILPEDKFEKEKGIVLEEIAKSLGRPDEQMERNIISVFYPGHAISLPTLGTYSTIESMERIDVEKFYKNKYVPNNMILSAVGSFESNEMLQKIKDIYGSIPPGEIKSDNNSDWLTGFKPLESKKRESSSVRHRFYNGNEIQIQQFYKLPAESSSELLALIDITLDRAPDGLHAELEAQFPGIIKSLTLQTRSSGIDHYLQSNLTVSSANHVVAITKRVSEYLNKMNFMLSPKTIRLEAIKAKTRFLKNIEKPHMFGIYNAQILAVEGIDAVLGSYSGSGFFTASRQLRNLSLDLVPEVIVQHPILENQENILEESTIISRYDLGETGPILIANRNPNSDLLAVHFLIKNKAALESKFGSNAAKILHDCFKQRLKTGENIAVGNRFGFSYTVNDNPWIPMDNIYLHPDFGYIRVEGLSDDLPGAIRFLIDRMTNFIPQKTEYEKAMNSFKRSSHMIGKNDARAAFDSTIATVIKEAIKYPISEKVPDYESLVQFTEQYFQAHNMIVSVISPVIPDSIKTLFLPFKGVPNGDFTDNSPIERGYKKQVENITVELEVGGEQTYLFWGFVKDTDPEDRAAIKVLSLILADKIIFDIREKQGMAYRINAGIDQVKGKAFFNIRFGTRPENADVLIPQFPGFFTMDMLKDLNEIELEKTVNMYLGRMMFRRLSSINQAFYLGQSEYFHDNIHYDSEFLDRLSKTSVTDVRRVAEKYMVVENTVSIVVR